MLQRLQSNFLKIVFYFFLISIPFGVRVLIHQFTNGFHEYEAVFIYLSDLLLVLFLILHFLKYGWVSWRKPRFIIAFLALSAFSIVISSSAGLAVYNFSRLLVLFYSALVIADLLKIGVIKFEGIVAAIGASAVFQSAVGFFQFFKQSSLGLGFFGESVLGADIGGAAKIVVDGGKILRAYGTFPHPNVFAAFLLIGLISLFYLWLKRPSERKWFSSFGILLSDLLVGLSIFVVSLGLLLAFSRTGWAIASLLTLVTIIYALFSKIYFRQGVRMILLMVVIFLTLIFGFKSYIFPRAQVFMNEPAVTQRLGYNQLGIDLIKSNLIGIGIGNQVLYSVQNGIYEKFGMNQVWQWQPIHNIYILVAAEIGILGLIAFLGFLLSSFIAGKNYYTRIMLVALLLFGLTDHFLWTLQPGRLMLWVVVGLLLGVGAVFVPAQKGVRP